MTGKLSIAIVGGGVTGLAAAHRLNELSAELGRSVEVTLFEVGSRVGGLVGTEKIEGHTVETGADSFITNKPWALDLCRRVGLESRIVPTNSAFRRSLILNQGVPTPTPEGFELIVPRKLQTLLNSPLLSVPGKMEVAGEPYVPPRTDESDESLAEFVRRRMGAEILERIIQPVVGGIYTSDPEHLSMLATLPRFVQMEREHGSLLQAVWSERRRGTAGAVNTESMDDPDGPDVSGARYGLFVSLRGGMSELLDALESRVRANSNIRLQTSVLSIEQLPGDQFGIATASGTMETFDGVIVALPAFRAAELLSAWDRDLAGCLRRIPYASSAIVVTGHRLEDIGHPLDAFGLVIPHVEGRRILAVSFLSRKFPDRSPDGTAQLRTFVGGAMQPELLEQSDESLLAMVRKELQDVLGVTGDPLFHRVVRYDRGMPQYHVGHLDLVDQIEQLECTHRGFALAGNAYRGVGLPDSIHSGEQAAARVLQTLSLRNSSKDSTSTMRTRAGAS